MRCYICSEIVEFDEEGVAECCYMAYEQHLDGQVYMKLLKKATVQEVDNG